jgi:AmmeMemoRadiSam system protein A
MIFQKGGDMDIQLTEAEKKELLGLARRTIELWIKEGRRPPLPALTEGLAAKAGAFVTIRKDGMLRGCIGHIIGTRSIAETVQEMAIAAATEDPRFPRLDESELGDIDIEISILSPIREVKDISEIEVGRDGLIITKGYYRGLLLPQVAVEYGWDREEFLENTCYKAGLPPDAWRDEDAKIEAFSALVFGEKDYMR